MYISISNCIYLFLLPTPNAFLIWGGSPSMRIAVGGKACYIGLEKSNAQFRILNLQGMFQRHRQLAASVPGGDIGSTFLPRAFL